MGRLDAREVTGWAVWERLHGPLGPERLDYLFAQLQATLANANRPKGKRPYKADDFAPPWADTKRWPWSGGKGHEPMTGEEMLRQIRGINRQMGGRVTGGDA